MEQLLETCEDLEVFEGSGVGVAVMCDECLSMYGVERGIKIFVCTACKQEDK